MNGQHRRVLVLGKHLDPDSFARCECNEEAGAFSCPNHDPANYARVWSKHCANAFNPAN